MPQKAGWGSPKIQKTHPAQDPLDQGHDDRAPQGGLDGGFRFPEDLVVVGLVQGGEPLDGLDEVVALEEHEKGDEQHQQQVEKEKGEALDEADGVGVDKGAGLGHHRLDDLRQIDVPRRQRQVQVDQVELEGVDLGGNPGPELAALHALGHLAGKFQGLGGDDAHQAEEGDQDDQEQDEAGDARRQDFLPRSRRVRPGTGAGR